MKGRLFNSLGSDLNGLILRYLTPLDLALSRVVCKTWNAIIPKQKLGRHEFYVTLSWYDRQEYVIAVEKHTVFGPSFLRKYVPDAPEDMENKSAIYTFLLKTRILNIVLNTYEVLLVCKDVPHSWENVLLSLITLDSQRRVELFWGAVAENCVTLLEWFFTKSFKITEFYLDGDDWIIPWKEFNSFRYLYDTNRVTKNWWVRYLDLIWKAIKNFKEKKQDFTPFFELVKICNTVPNVVCEQATIEQHEQFNHICGCEKTFVFKKRKKE